jgi:alkanesulfonate monooxygenase SsuD/methylene tetrahydromethanopterin reductase-like flavin-dependent oxidoreductase (luciferase family)
MQNVTQLLRKIWKGEVIIFADEMISLKNYYTRYGLDSQIPIYFGVRGPNLLDLTGKFADGVILSGSKTYLKKAALIVKKSLEKNHRSRENFIFVVWIPTIVTFKKQELNLAKQTVVFVLNDMPASVLGMTNINLERLLEIQKIYKRYGLEIASKLVTEEIVEEFAICGSPKEVCEAFKTFQPLGVNEVVFGPPYGLDKKRAILDVVKYWRDSL